MPEHELLEKMEEKRKELDFWWGARNHAILMSVLTTCKKRDESFMETVKKGI